MLLTFLAIDKNDVSPWNNTTDNEATSQQEPRKYSKKINIANETLPAQEWEIKPNQLSSKK